MKAIVVRTHYGSCVICKRPLTRPESVARGMGPVCAARQERKLVMSDAPRQMTLFDPVTEGFIFRRTAEGLASNLPWLVRHHSADGFEIGYGGSGPADAALNICEFLLRRIGYRGPTMKCSIDGKCFVAAFEMHQEAKWHWIATLPHEGGAIPYAEALAWVERQIAHKTSLTLSQGEIEYA